MTYVEEKAARARDLFLAGYTCSHAICGAFAEETQISEDILMRISAPFGGGMGRLREVCGAVSGVFMVLGAIYGDDIHQDRAAKAELYKHVQALAGAFRHENGSILCRELLSGGASTDSTPDARTPEYYKKRPCSALVADAARLLATYLETHKKGQ